MGQVTSNPKQNFSYVYDICKNHPACENCCLAGRRPMIIAGDTVKCATGYTKPRKE